MNITSMAFNGLYLKFDINHFIVVQHRFARINWLLSFFHDILNADQCEHVIHSESIVAIAEPCVDHLHFFQCQICFIDMIVAEPTFIHYQV